MIFTVRGIESTKGLSDPSCEAMMQCGISAGRSKKDTKLPVAMFPACHLRYSFPKNVNAATTSASTPVCNVGCIAGAKPAL